MVTRYNHMRVNHTKTDTVQQTAVQHTNAHTIRTVYSLGHEYVVLVRAQNNCIRPVQHGHAHVRRRRRCVFISAVYVCALETDYNCTVYNKYILYMEIGCYEDQKRSWHITAASTLEVHQIHA